MTTTAKPTSIPPGFEDVALISAATCAAPGQMSVSWWNEEVRAGRAPQPVIRATRCTRWRLADVREFWRKRAEKSPESVVAAAQVQARAEKASARARQLRTIGKAAPAAAQ